MCGFVRRSDQQLPPSTGEPPRIFSYNRTSFDRNRRQLTRVEISYFQSELVPMSKRLSSSELIKQAASEHLKNYSVPRQIEHVSVGAFGPKARKFPVFFPVIGIRPQRAARADCTIFSSDPQGVFTSSSTQSPLSTGSRRLGFEDKPSSSRTQRRRTSYPVTPRWIRYTLLEAVMYSV
jgi:hypothetical protein